MAVDPLRTGKIYEFDPSIFKKMRPQVASLTPKPVFNPLEGLSREEIIPGLKAKFDDVFRRTPNPMGALFGSPSYIPPQMTNTPVTILSPHSTPILHHTTPLQSSGTSHVTPIATSRLDSHVGTPLVPIHEDEMIESSAATPSDEDKQHDDDRSERLERKPQNSPARSLSTPSQKANHLKEKPKTEGKSSNATEATNRQISSEGKKLKRARTGVCDSLSMLFVPSKQSEQVNKKDVSSTKSVLMDEKSVSSRTTKSKSPRQSNANQSVQQRLFVSPSKGESLTITPEKVSKRTRSRTRNGPGILGQLSETTNSQSAQSISAGSKSGAKPSKSATRSNKTRKSSSNVKTSSEIQRERPKSKRRKQDSSESESASESASEDRSWKKQEIQALQQAHRECPVNAPNFWELVADKMNQILGSSSRTRSSEECYDQWYKALNEMKEPRKRKVRADSQSDGGEVNRKPKRRTQAQLRNMLEEAFLGDADDIFDQQSLSHPSLSSTPHRNPLHSSTLNSILSMKSPLDLNSSKDSPPQTKHLHSNESESNHWEASYVNKMKKQQKSNRNQASRSKGSTARRQSKEKRSANHRLLNETREEFHVNKEGGRAIAARMNGLGKVTLSIEQRQDDDSEDEEILKKLEESDEEEVESWTEEEEQEWDG